MSAPVIRPGILDIKPYVGGQSRIPGVKRVIKLASNEGALGPSPKAVAAYKKAASTMFRYPDGGSAELRKAIGEYHRLDPECIVCGAGSDELLSLLCRAYAGPGDEVLYNFHGFAIYPILARTCGATPVTAPEKNLRADVDNLLAAVTPNTKVLFIANPNNPTSSYISAQEMRRLRTELREDILLVIDAAYAEYVGRNDYSAGFDLVDGGDNVVVTRTFSKIYGLGGVRLGWCYAPHRVADVLNRIRLPFSVSGPAQAAGVAALADTEFTAKSRAHNDLWLPWLDAALRGLGLDVAPSVCNFVLAHFPNEPGRDAGAADTFLKSRGIIPRRVVDYGLPNSLRITVGLDTEMRKLVEALSEFLGQGRS